MDSDSFPETRTTAMPARPGAVIVAQMVSLSLVNLMILLSFPIPVWRLLHRINFYFLKMPIPNRAAAHAAIFRQVLVDDLAIFWRKCTEVNRFALRER